MHVFFLANKERTGKFPQHKRYMLSRSPGNSRILAMQRQCAKNDANEYNEQYEIELQRLIGQRTEEKADRTTSCASCSCQENRQ
jgi:hypothetical protein